MKKKIITTASAVLGIAAALSTSTVFAQAQYAFDLGVYPKCDGCHENAADYYGGNKRNVLPGAAWNHLAISAPIAPATPTCVAPQVLNASNVCVTPVPVCKGGTILNAAKDTCVTPPPPTCVSPQVLNATKDACVTPILKVPVCKSTEVLTANVCVAKPAPVVTPKPVTPTPVIPVSKINTKPVLNAVALQWDAKVGELITIPLSVKDTEQDAFMMIGSVAGSKFSAVHPDEKTLLPTIDFQWTPTAVQVNKIYTIPFQAKETKTTQKFISNKVSVRIRVWAASDRNSASITKLNVMTNVWTAGKLNLAGNVIFNNLLTAAERKNFIAQKLDLTVSDSKGVLVGSTPLTLDEKGNWSVVLPATQATCDIILQFDGQNAARTIAGCIKPVAAVTPVIVANNTPLKSSENGEHEGDDHHADGHDD
jgi:hypothetical protein